VFHLRSTDRRKRQTRSSLRLLCCWVAKGGAGGHALFPSGNIWASSEPIDDKYSRPVTSLEGMKALIYTLQDIGRLVRETRKGLGVTQKELAQTSGTGLRFIIELGKGKETAEIGKVLTILQTLAIQLTLTPPAATKRG
jgi:HTH-type transcriptional regulator/antitoxin HipB